MIIKITFFNIFSVSEKDSVQLDRFVVWRSMNRVSDIRYVRKTIKARSRSVIAFKKRDVFSLPRMKHDRKDVNVFNGHRLGQSVDQFLFKHLQFALLDTFMFVIPDSNEVFISDADHSEGARVDHCLVGNLLDHHSDIGWHISLSMFPVSDLTRKDWMNNAKDEYQV